MKKSTQHANAVYVFFCNVASMNPERKHFVFKKIKNI